MKTRVKIMLADGRLVDYVLTGGKFKNGDIVMYDKSTRRYELVKPGDRPHENLANSRPRNRQDIIH